MLYGFCIFYKNTDVVNSINKIENLKNESVQTTVPEGYIGIYNEEDFANIAKDLSGNYILMVDMTDKTYTIIGSSTKTFTGILDGNYHTISNLNISMSTQYVGLFGYINSGTVKKLTLENETVKGGSAQDTYIGGLVGYNQSGTTWF